MKRNIFDKLYKKVENWLSHLPDKNDFAYEPGLSCIMIDSIESLQNLESKAKKRKSQKISYSDKITNFIYYIFV